MKKDNPNDSESPIRFTRSPSEFTRQYTEYAESRNTLTEENILIDRVVYLISQLRRKPIQSKYVRERLLRELRRCEKLLDVEVVGPLNGKADAV